MLKIMFIMLLFEAIIGIGLVTAIEISKANKEKDIVDLDYRLD